MAGPVDFVGRELGAGLGRRARRILHRPVRATRLLFPGELPSADARRCRGVAAGPRTGDAHGRWLLRPFPRREPRAVLCGGRRHRAGHRRSHAKRGRPLPQCGTGNASRSAGLPCDRFRLRAGQRPHHRLSRRQLTDSHAGNTGHRDRHRLRDHQRRRHRRAAATASVLLRHCGNRRRAFARARRPGRSHWSSGPS